MSETAHIRHEVLKYCKGKGIDLGCGGDKVCPEAWGFDMQTPYNSVGDDHIELRGDARNLSFINDDSLDYIYSSHLLEDFPDTRGILAEWLRVIKPGGYCILYLPDEQIYRRHCAETGQHYNKAHTIAQMSLGYMKGIVQDMPVKVVDEIELINTYSFLIVLRKASYKHIYESIPGWFDYQDIYSQAVKNIDHSGHIVEVGSFMGKSSAYMAVEIANSGKDILFDCVDTWEGTQDDTYNSREQAQMISELDCSLFNQFIKNIAPVRSFIAAVRMPSAEAALNYQDGSLDFVFIDAAHDYESVKADIAAWYPKVRFGGTLAGHDYEENWPGVMQAVNEFAIINNYNVVISGNSWVINV